MLADPLQQAWVAKSLLHWVPLALSINQESERILYSKLILMEQKVSSLRPIITADESRFFLYYSRDSVWVASHDELPRRIKQKTDTEKCLVSILWSVNGIHSLHDVPRGKTYKTAFFTDAVLTSLIERGETTSP
jgi:hypothetical protein